MKCLYCGNKVEPEREWYAMPTCYECLPPPPPLPLTKPLTEKQKARITEVVNKPTLVEIEAEPAPLPRRAMTIDERELVDSVFHQDGRCACAGEGRCEWCRAHCGRCGMNVKAFGGPSDTGECDHMATDIVRKREKLSCTLTRGRVKRNMDKVLREHPEYVPRADYNADRYDALLESLVDAAMECIAEVEKRGE